MTQAEPPPGLMAAWGQRGTDLVADTPRAWLWRVKQGDVAAVLKVLKPGAADEARGMALRA
jgi:streptomycin 6-kinase